MATGKYKRRPCEVCGERFKGGGRVCDMCRPTADTRSLFKRKADRYYLAMFT